TRFSRDWSSDVCSSDLGWHIVFVIDTKDGDTLLCKRDQKTVLGVTGGAPGSPDVQQADLAFEYFLIHQTVSVFQRRQMECWYRFIDECRGHGIGIERQTSPEQQCQHRKDD